MITSDGEPSELFYQNDMLHLNKVGYGLLTKLIKEQLWFIHIITNFSVKKIYMKTGPKPRKITTQLLEQIEI